MSKMKQTKIKWIPEISENFSIGYVKQYFNISKDLSNEGEPERVLKLARAGIVEKDVTKNEGQMAASYAGYNKVLIGDLVLNPMDLYSGANCNVSELNGVISPAYSNLRAKNKSLIYSKYYDYFFKTQYWTMAMFAHGKGVSFDNRWTLNNDTLKSYEIPILSLDIQKKIVSAIESKTTKIDALISNEEKQIEKLNNYKQSLITETVTKGLKESIEMKESGIEWIGEIPQKWNLIQLSSLFFQHKEKNTGLKNENLLSLSYGKIKQKDITTKDGLLPENFEGYNIITSGDIVLRLTDLQNDHKSLRVGYSEQDGIVTSAYVTIRKRNNNLNTKYFYYLIHTFDIKKGFYGMGSGVRQGLNFDELKKLVLCYPDQGEQEEIATFLDTKCTQIDKLISIKKLKIEKLNTYKKSLIYEYVTGKREA